jgi:hypothetical protein
VSVHTGGGQVMVIGGSFRGVLSITLEAPPGGESSPWAELRPITKGFDPPVQGGFTLVVWPRA